jgi:hypothetical protein
VAYKRVYDHHITPFQFSPKTNKKDHYVFYLKQSIDSTRQFFLPPTIIIITDLTSSVASTQTLRYLKFDFQRPKQIFQFFKINFRLSSPIIRTQFNYSNEELLPRGAAPGSARGGSRGARGSRALDHETHFVSDKRNSLRLEKEPQPQELLTPGSPIEALRRRLPRVDWDPRQRHSAVDQPSSPLVAVPILETPIGMGMKRSSMHARSPKRNSGIMEPNRNSVNLGDPNRNSAILEAAIHLSSSTALDPTTRVGIYQDPGKLFRKLLTN